MSTRRRNPKSEKATDPYEYWVNVIRFIEKKGQMTPQGCVIPAQLWRRFKRMVAQEFDELSDDNKELVRKMTEGL